MPEKNLVLLNDHFELYCLSFHPKGDFAPWTYEISA